MTFLRIVLVLHELGVIQSDRGVIGTGVFVSTDEEGEEQFITNLESTTHNLALYGSNTIDLDDKTSKHISSVELGFNENG